LAFRKARFISLNQNDVNGMKDTNETIPPKDQPQVKPRKKGLSLVVKLLIAGLLLFMVVGFIAAIQITKFLTPFYEKAMSIDLDKLDKFDVTTVFYDRNNREIGRLFIEDRILLDHDEIPDRMREAVLAVEDKRFYDHPGIDAQGLFRAFYVNLRQGHTAEGGSTITQQLAKHLLGDFSKTLDRKAVEAFLALRVEKVKTKQEILDYYLNRIYFGKGYFGVGAAARGYFGKEAKDLSVAECAMLAGIVKSPNSASPRNNLQGATERRNSAIRRMANEGFITPEQAASSIKEPIKLVPAPPIGVQTYFMAMAVQELDSILGLGENDPLPQGLRVVTTQDLSLQISADKELEARLQTIEQQVKNGDKSDKATLQAAAVVLEAKSGAIRVIIGGKNFLESPYDRARMARRENGALLQPFLYALAFEKLGLHPASMVNASYLDPSTVDSSKQAGLGDPRKDLGKRFLTVQDALVLSNKASAARTGTVLGAKQVANWLQTAGVPRVSAKDPATIFDLQQLTLLEATALYQVFSQAGVYHSPYCIEKIFDEKDKITYEAKKESKKILDSVTAQQMALTLQSVVRDNNSATLGKNYSFPQSVAGMSGYSEGYRDAWFVGCSPSLAAGVWVGYDRSTPLGGKAVAAQTAVPLWADIMGSLLLKYPPDLTFPIPSSLAKVEVDRRTGIIRGLGFLSPSAGNVFVYLKQKQLLESQKAGDTPAARVQQPDNWSDWLSTLYSASGDAGILGESEDPPVASLDNDIPHVAEYRIPGLRGNILSAEGEAFATLENSDELVLSWPSPDIAPDADKAVAWMRSKLTLASQWLGTPIEFSEAELRSLYRFQRFHPLIVAERLISEQSAAFPASVLAFEGFSLQSVPRRVYPYQSMMSQTLGYMLRKQGRNKKKYVADEVIFDDYKGGGGLEQLFDSDLRGEEGKFVLATTPEGFTQATVVTKEPGAGHNVRTTINASLQRSAEKALATGFKDTSKENVKEGPVRSGAIVVVDVRNGDILALASYPNFDPNEFIPGLSPEKWAYLVKAPKNPLMNKTFAQQHPPGSVFKVLTAIAAVQAGKLDPAKALYCPGYFQIGNVTYNLPKEKGYFDFNAALARSVNTYFFDLGLKAGRDTLVQTGKDFGVGQSTGIILPGEMLGRMPDPEFVLKVHKRWMGGGDVTNTSIGQGDVLMTPLQMANVMAAVANGGTLYKSRLVRQVEKPNGEVTRYIPTEILHQITVDPVGLKTVQDALAGVVENGTGRRMRDRMLLGLKKEPERLAKLSQLKIGAKTGTAQSGKKLEKRSEKQIIWIAGYAPADKPEIAFVVMIEGDPDQDLHAGADAGPLAGIVLRDYFSPEVAKLAQALGAEEEKKVESKDEEKGREKDRDEE